MKGKNLFFTGLIALVVGLLLILFRVPLANGGVVFAAGAIFLGAGLVNMLFFLGSRDNKNKVRAGAFATTFGWIASAAAVLLGVSMLIFKDAFVALIGFMFGVLLLFTALFQLFLLLFGSKPVTLPGWFYVVPTILAGGALFIFFRDPSPAGEKADIIITGVGFIFFGVFTIIEGSLIGRSNHIIRKAADEAAKDAAAKLSAPKKEIGTSENAG